MNKLLLLLLFCLGVTGLLRATPQTLSVSGSDIVLGQSVTFTAHAIDPEAELTWLHFFVNGPGLPGWNYAGSVQVSGQDATNSIVWTPGEAGGYAVHVRAQNTSGEWDWNANMANTFSVNAPNTNPQTNWINAADTVVGATAHFTGNASDPDGNLVWLHFYVNGPNLPGWNYAGSTPISGADATASLDWAPTEPGSYAVHIRAQDSWGIYDWNGNVATTFSVGAANHAPAPSVTVDGYENGATVARPPGGNVTVTIHFGATDTDGNLAGIRPQTWHQPSNYLDNNGGAMVAQSGGSGEVVRSVVLDRNGDWFFWTDAVDDAGVGANSPPWQSGFRLNVIQSPDTSPPTVPGGLSASLVTSSSFTFSWAPSADNVGVARYEVRIGNQSLGEVSATAMSVSGLSPENVYSISVRARDASFNWSAWSSPMSVATSSGTSAGDGDSLWIDVNNDGLRDEISGASSGRFSYFITSWWSPTYSWVYDFNDFWNWNDVWFRDDRGDSPRHDLFTLQWHADWYLTGFTETSVDLNFSVLAEPGYDYRVSIDNWGGDQLNFNHLGDLLGLLNFPDGGVRSIIKSNFGVDGLIDARFYLTRISKPVGGLSIGSPGGVSLGSLTKGNFGTVTIPGLGTVVLGGFGQLLIPAGVSPVLSIKDTLDKIIHAGPQVVWDVWDLLTNTQLNLGGVMTSLDLGIDFQGHILVGAKLDDSNTVWFDIDIKRPPSVAVVSRDKYLAGSVSIPDGYEGMEIEFVNTTTGESLGRYGKLLGGGTTRIYNAVPDILSDADVLGGGQAESQKVWFVKDPGDSRKLSFYTCFNSVGTIQVRLWQNNEIVGQTSHQLVTAEDFAYWITYVDNWITGVDFDFPGGPPPVGALSNGGGIRNATRACLIPFFNVIAQVEGLEATALGLFEGVKAGLSDDGKTALLIRDGYLVAEGWAAPQVIDEIVQWRDNPLKRATQLMGMAVQLCQDGVFTSYLQSHPELSTWEGLRTKAWAVWGQIAGLAEKRYAIVFGLNARVAIGLMDWADDFGNRMMAGAERSVFRNAPWRTDEFANDMIGFGRTIAFAGGYYLGYLAEQVAMATLTSGTFTIAKVLIKGGATLSSSLAKRTAFMVAADMALLKKVVQGATTVELRSAIHLALVEAARTPLNAAVRTSRLEFLETAFRSAGFRDEFTVQKMVENMVGLPRHQQLFEIYHAGGLFLERTADVAVFLGDKFTGRAVRGWQNFFECLLPLKPDELERGSEFLAAFPATEEGRPWLKETLEGMADKTPAEIFNDRGAKVSSRIANIYIQMYAYMDASTLLNHAQPIGNGRWLLDLNDAGRFVSPYNIPAGVTAKSEARAVFQLPSKGTDDVTKAYTRGAFKGTIRTGDVADDFSIPQSVRHGDGSANVGQPWLEINAKDNPERGPGLKPQFTQKKAVVVLVENQETGVLVNTKEEIAAWLDSLGLPH